MQKRSLLCWLFQVLKEMHVTRITQWWLPKFHSFKSISYSFIHPLQFKFYDLRPTQKKNFYVKFLNEASQVLTSPHPSPRESPRVERWDPDSLASMRSGLCWTKYLLSLCYPPDFDCHLLNCSNWRATFETTTLGTSRMSKVSIFFSPSWFSLRISSLIGPLVEQPSF